MNTSASKFIGSIPENYDSGLGPVLFVGWASEIADLVAQRQPNSVLELAAGTGFVSRVLRDRLPGSTRLVVTDLNAPMLQIARAKFGEDENVEFQTVDATDLGFPEGCFDYVLCQFGVMFFPDKARSHSEVFRVLKAGGTYLFTTWDAWDVNRFGQTIHETIGAFFPTDPPGFYKVPYGYCDRDEIRNLMEQVGFNGVEVKQASIDARIDSASDFARGLVFGNPLYEEILSRGGDPEAVRSALEAVIEDEIGPKLTLGIVIAQGRK